MSAKRRFGRLAVGLVASSLVLAACNAGGAGTSKGTVNIAVNPWVGYEADAAVVAHILEEEMDYTVEKKNLAEDVSWQGFESGEIDVILENWGHPALEEEYISQKGVAVDGGSTGNIGIIGWYVPKWMVDEHPDIVEWENLNKYADLFKTSESGDLGEFLGTDPSYVQYDEALIENLGLNFKVRFTGSEASTVEAIQQAVEQELPLLFYWWDPHWLNSQVELVRINLPEYTEGCDADLEAIECDYPETDLNKILRKEFADEGGDAATLIKNFKWTNLDQNTVADYMTNQDMSAEEAAAKWVADNEAVWKTWLP
jgi:glycine betaine/proline transport system substrate-binding protein